MTRARSLSWRAGVAARAAPPEGLRILVYHRVARERDFLAVRAGRFRRQMEALAAAGYSAVDLETAVDELDAGQPRSKLVALTFDDGYRDVAENALPVLDEHGFRATVFVVPRAVDGAVRFPWYDEHPPLLTWDEIAGLDGGVLRFEAHTLTHPNLLGLDEPAAREEIAGSKTELEARLGRAVTLFCYPGGAASERERRLVSESGFRAAVTAEPGTNEPFSDRYLLRRTAIDRSDRELDFRAKVAGAHDAPLPLQRLYGRRRFGSEPTRPSNPTSPRR